MRELVCLTIIIVKNNQLEFYFPEGENFTHQTLQIITTISTCQMCFHTHIGE